MPFIRSLFLTLALRFVVHFAFGSLPLFAQETDTLLLPQEHHLRNIRQLTFGGENAEAYFSFDGKRLSFQSTHSSFTCDQIYAIDTNGSNLLQISNGRGRTTCAYFLPGDSTLLYSSTHLQDSLCPPRPDYSKGYVWAVYAAYDIFVSTSAGVPLHRLTTTDGYDAEATVSPLGDRIVFTSTRDGDLDLYSMKIDGTDLKRLTNELGYDGGAFYSPDGSQLVYRADHPEKDSEKKEYTELLAQGLVRPSRMQIYIMNADGTGKRRITSFPAANFAPYFHPDGKRIIFASNMNDPKGRNFDLFLISNDGTNLEQITFNATFDGFPMFSRDGSKVVFSSNRNGMQRGETNIFIADWVP